MVLKSWGRRRSQWGAAGSRERKEELTLNPAAPQQFQKGAARDGGGIVRAEKGVTIFGGRRRVGGEKVQKGFLKSLLTDPELASFPSPFFSTTPSQSLWLLFPAYSLCFFPLSSSAESNVCVHMSVCVCTHAHAHAHMHTLVLGSQEKN